MSTAPTTLSVKRRFEPIGHSEWEREPFDVLVWHYDGESYLTHPVQCPDGYFPGLLRTFMNGEPCDLRTFDEGLGREKLGITRADILKEVLR
jgi:hypothetical protein